MPDIKLPQIFSAASSSGAVVSRSRFHSFGLVFFGLCLIVFLIVRVGFIGTVLDFRHGPIEPDDSYGYILKAVQIDDCLLQDCPALTDLREQTKQYTPDFKRADARYRQYHRTIFQFHPLHSAVLHVLHAAGISWEQAYDAVQLAGTVLMGLSVACFLYAIWGPGAAGVALAILSVTFYRGHGLHTIVPSNLALMAALAIWAAMVRGIRNPILIVGGILVMMTMHPIGRIYSGVTLVLYALWLPRPWTHRNLWTLASGVGLLAVWSSLGFVITRPAFSISPFPGWVENLPLLSTVKGNLQVAYELLQGMVNNLGGRFSSSLVLMLALLALPRKRRFTIYSLTIVLAVTTSLGLMHSLPGYYGTLLTRLWIPFNLVLMGAVGFVAWRLCEIALDNLPKLLKSPIGSLSNKRYVLSIRGWTVAAMFAVGLLLAQSFAAMALNGASFVGWYSRALMRSSDPWFDPVQPKILVRMSKPNHDVLYQEEAQLYYFLSYGALTRGAVYKPGVVGTELENELIEENPNLRHAVGINPVYDGALRLDGETRVEISSPSGLNAGELSFYLVNRNDAEAELELSVPGESGRRTTLTVPAASSVWLKAGKIGEGHPFRILLRSSKEDGLLFLMGVRKNETQETYWPWNTDMTLHPRGWKYDSDKIIPIRFITSALAPEVPWSVEVVADLGASVLLKLER
jgi:hypothetical protein